MDDTLTIMSMNIRDGAHGHLAELADLITAQKPDIVGIQEAKGWRRPWWSPRRHGKALRTVMEATGLRVAIYTPSRTHSCDLVTLIGPRIQPTGYRRNVGEGHLHHGASRFRFTLDGRPKEEVWEHLNTHFSPFSGAHRLIEASWLTEYAGAPRCLLTGDLNSDLPEKWGGITDPLSWDRLIPPNLRSRHLRPGPGHQPSDRDAMALLIEAGWRSAHLDHVHQATVGHWPGSESWEHAPDHILVSSDLAADVLRHETLRPPPGVEPFSDHHAIVATLAI
ncbi:endonuclease/exonuclease/phosphatase family protein [Streptomyces albidoflavus]